MITKICSTLIGLFVSVSLSSADQILELSTPFTNNMILQREATVPVWGFDQPGSKITVTFAGQTKTAVTDDRGNWMLKLDLLKSSKVEREFSVKNDRDESIKLTGVLVGEVWFASGQSNMTWIASKSKVRDLAQEIASAKEEVLIRQIDITTKSSFYPLKRGTSTGGWQSSKSALTFSAISLAFANELYKELDVPIGIILAANTNTRLEAFAPREGFELHPKLAADVKLMHDADPRLEQGRNAYEQYYKDLAAWQKKAAAAAEAGNKFARAPGLPGIANMWRGPSQFYNGKIAPIVPYAIRGTIWCQGTSNGNDGKIYAARMEALLNGYRKVWNMPDMPFYFTQMQPYGSENPKDVGFGDIRQAQHLFFINNRKNVGMVVQSDINSAHGGIHYQNKLHPGIRLSRWALAHEYGKKIAFTGPIFKESKIDGNKAIVSFEKDSLFGGLMVASKGSEVDFADPTKYVEPAKPTPGDKLNHFRLCGEDLVWHAAEANIVNDTVVVTSAKVSAPIGVQYAYFGFPRNSNLYNKAGLPATPFAVVNGKLIFEEDKASKVAAPSGNKKNTRPFLQVANYLRNGAIIQRNKAIPVWGYTNEGVTVKVTLGDVTKSVIADAQEKWSVSFPAMKASTKPIILKVAAENGANRTVQDILIGDVWFLTGSPLLTSDWVYNRRDKEAVKPVTMPLVREFRRKTNGFTSSLPRKRKFEQGGAKKYRSFWLTADYSDVDSGVTMFAYEFAKALDRKNIPQGFINMSYKRMGKGKDRKLRGLSPLSLISLRAAKEIKNPEFKTRVDELMLNHPNSQAFISALEKHITDTKAFVASVVEAQEKGSDFTDELPLPVPPFPSTGKSRLVSMDTIPTFAYNWLVSPFAPVAVAGVVWVPSEGDIGKNPAEYATELEIYAASLPATYGQEKVQLLYAQPAASLVEGITAPKIENSKSMTFDKWPNTMKEIAAKLGKQAKAK